VHKFRNLINILIYIKLSFKFPNMPISINMSFLLLTIIIIGASKLKYPKRVGL